MNNKKNIYKKYFYNLNSILTKLNNKFLFYIPDLYKRDLRKDKISIIKINFNFFKSLFQKSYLFDNYERTINTEICFISHYVGNVDENTDLDFYYGSLFRNLNKKISLSVILINHTNESLKEVRENFRLSNINRIYVNNDFNFITDIIIYIKILKEYTVFIIHKFLNYKKFNKISKNYDFSLFFNARYTYKLVLKILNILDLCKNLKNLVTTPIVVSKITNQVLEKQDKLEVVDLNIFEKAIITENAIPEPSRKKKISTIEELLQDVQGVTEKKDTQTLLLSIDNKLTHLIANQQKILEKFAITSVV